MPRIAHISDLHFSRMSKSPFQIFSKRWIGNVNLLLARKKRFYEPGLNALPQLFLDLKIDTVLISGDISCTSDMKEFEAAKKYIEEFQKNGLEVLLIPGNHDQYTRKSFRENRFYRFFPDPDLKNRGVARKKISDKWWVVLIDTAVATSWISSCGEFRKEVESNLIQTLNSIDPGDKIILLNHYPLFHNSNPRSRLRRADALQEIIYNQPNIHFYLHGHSHRHCVADLRGNRYPILLDSGSTAEKMGTWNLIDIQAKNCRIESYRRDPENNSWDVFKTTCLDLN